MVFAGISDDQDIDDLIAFLKQYGPDGKTQSETHSARPMRRELVSRPGAARLLAASHP